MSREPEIVATLERKPWIVLLPDGRLAALYLREKDMAGSFVDFVECEVSGKSVSIRW